MDTATGNEVKCVELFAGAGGAALGLEAAGFEHLALVEWDADACATLRAAGLGPVVEGDVRDLGTLPVAACDLLWSSFPCQAWSTAGKRRGAEDERNGWPWTVAAIDHLSPRWFLGENVRGLTYHRGGCPHKGGQPILLGATDPRLCPGCYLERVIVPELASRFTHAGYWVLDAADYGVPQHRRRVILWAGPTKLEAPTPTHGPGRPQPFVSMGEALGLSEQRVIGGGRNPGEAGAMDRRHRDLTDEPSTTVAAVQIGNAGPWVMSHSRNTAANPSQERVTPSSEPAPAVGGKGNQMVAWSAKPAPTVAGGQGGKGCGQVSANAGTRARLEPELMAATGRRRLTVKECAKLQAFPDDHPWQGTKTSQYSQVGNAVPPTLAAVVARTIVLADPRLLAVPSL